MDEGLGFFGNLALGRLASSADANADWRATEAFFRGIRRRGKIAAQQANLENVIGQYNQLAAEYNYAVDVAKQWMSWGEARKQQIAQLKPDLAAANRRAEDSAAREADLRERLDAAEGYIQVMGKNAERQESEVNRLLIEIEHLKRG